MKGQIELGQPRPFNALENGQACASGTAIHHKSTSLLYLMSVQGLIGLTD